jgi:protein-S-isoprenylcysteine O-methyltransferase Ste14
MNDAVHLAVIAAVWVLYGVVHSWLAANGTKRALFERWPKLRPAYRLLYNGVATVLALPPLALTWLYPGAALWHWPAWAAWGAFLIATAGFIVSMRWYDGLDFLGLRQWARRHEQIDRCDGFVLSPLHRYVRHPWYSLGLLYLWTRDLNAGWLVAAVIITLYLVVGSRLEERKLVEAFGDPYRRYLQRVPGLVPLPGRRLTQDEARSITRADSPMSDSSDYR